MQSGSPSRTALAAAKHRAAHQLLEHGRIFSDPLAVRIIGADADELAREAQADPGRRGMRLFIAVRTRFAEDALAAAIDHGVRQLIVLGAGLDTYAYRNAIRMASSTESIQALLKIYEVDHPATQTWKRERLAQANIAIPSSLTFAPVDFESQTLRQGLSLAGFDFSQPAFFTWLGVVPYLSAQAIWTTLEFIGSLPRSSHVVFDYANPPESLQPQLRAAHEQRAKRVAKLGEAWVSYFASDTLHEKLRSLGFTNIDDLGPMQIADRYFNVRDEEAAARGKSNNGGHVVHAAT